MSAALAAAAGVDMSAFPCHDLLVRGREAPVHAHAVGDPADLEPLLDAAPDR